MKQARYFPGQSPAAASKMPATKKSSVGMGLNQASYLPSFHNASNHTRLGGGYAVGGTSGNSVGTLSWLYHVYYRDWCLILEILFSCECDRNTLVFLVLL